MRLILTTLLVVFFVSSCKKSENCTPAQFTYEFSENKKLDTVRLGGYLLSTQIAPGTNLVFSYLYTGEFCKGRTDGPASERLFFETPGNVTTFDYSSADLEKSSCYYVYSAGDGSTNDAMKIFQGTIKGNKISASTWSIEADVIISGRGAPLEFKKSFTMQ